MRSTSTLLTACALLLTTGCEDEITGPTEVTPETGATPADAGVQLAVMTRNLYVGADADAVIFALATPDPSDDLPALVTAVGELRQTDWARRAEAFADEIVRERPHAVGLQEVSSIDITIPPLDVAIHLDFLPVLLAELAERGLNYTVAARIRNFDVAPVPGVRLADDDALLLDAGRVTVHATSARRFAANVGEVAPGVVLERGWVSASVSVGGRPYTIASTHLESGATAGLPQLRALQAAELVQALAGSPSTVVMGDLNDVPGSPMHQVLISAGYLDVWAELRPGVVGFTCCHLPNLANQVEQFDERIDYVLARGLGESLQGQVKRMGEVPADQIAGPEHSIWPSDHAGLVARLAGIPTHP